MGRARLPGLSRPLGGPGGAGSREQCASSIAAAQPHARPQGVALKGTGNFAELWADKTVGDPWGLAEG